MQTFWCAVPTLINLSRLVKMRWGWFLHNSLKTIANVMILHSSFDDLFLATTIYEFVVDPLALAARGHPAPHSLIAHHFMVLLWAIAMFIANQPRRYVISVIAANRVVMYGSAAIRGTGIRIKITKAVLSTLQFVMAAIDGFVVLVTIPSVSSLQTTIAASQFGVVAGLAMYHLWMASRRYGIVLVDTHTSELPTLIPVWVPSLKDIEIR